MYVKLDQEWCGRRCSCVGCTLAMARDIGALVVNTALALALAEYHACIYVALSLGICAL